MHLSDKGPKGTKLCAEVNKDTQISGCVQILLASCTMGIEMCATFIQIFAVLYLQFLGVPTSLVSMNGVITGVTSLFLLPLVGWFSDRGSNPVARKLMTMSVSLIIYLMGLSGVSLCGILKIIYFNDIQNQDGLLQVNNTAIDWESNLTFTEENNSGDLTSMPLSGYLGIVCFALLDIGFDMSMALSRAFMLECVPTPLHTRVLLIASGIQSMSGLTFAAISTIDFSDHLNIIFKFNGTAATIVMYGLFLATVVLISFSCTMITGFHLLRNKHTSGESSISANKSFKTHDPAEDHHLNDQSNKFRKLWPNRSRKDSSSLGSVDMLKESEGLTRPLLMTDECRKSNNYMSMSYETASLQTIEETTRNKINTGTEEQATEEEGEGNEVEQSLASSFSSNESGKLAVDDVGSFEDGAGSFSGSFRNPFHDHVTESMASACDEQTIVVKRRGYGGDHYPKDAITALGAFKASYSMSLSVANSAFTQEPYDRRSLLEIPTSSTTSKSPMAPATTTTKNSSKNRLVILCVSSFFAVGSMLCILAFAGNALTIDIYRGVPTALPGTEGYRMYKKGLTNAAWGNFAMYAVFTLVSLANKKIIDLIGERLQFTVSHTIFVGVSLSLLLAKSEGLFFTLMSVSGLTRACVYTLPYILANKFTQEEGGATSGTSSSPSQGKVMTLIGFLIPLHNLIVSALMGPLMEAADNVWVPIFYSLASAAFATVFFALLFFVKH